MISLATLLAVGAAFFVVAVSPGPANIANATVAMSRGRAASFRFATGLSCGLVVWGVVAATGLGAVLQSSVYVLMTLKVLGGLYLLWLAYQSGRAALRPGALQPVSVTEGRWFYRGLLLNLSNPKSVIAWMAALSVGLDPGASLTSVAAATGLCMALGFVNNYFYTAVFSLSGVMATYSRIRRWVDGVVAGLFAVAGLGMIRSALAR